MTRPTRADPAGRVHLDLWTLTGIHDLDAAQTRAAIEATAAHRQITLRPLSQAVAALADILRTNGPRPDLPIGRIGP